MTNLYDLNFWEEPDWSRESSINPLFSFVATLCLFIVIGLGLVFAEKGKLQTKINELDMVKQQNMPIKPKAEKTSTVKKEIADWQKAVDVYRQLDTKNFAWSSQLETIERLIPDQIIITSLSMTTQRAEDIEGTKDTFPLPAWTALVTLEGVAGGLEPYQTITTLFDKLANDKLLAKIMVPNLAKTTAVGNKKQFKIDLKYMAR